MRNGTAVDEPYLAPGTVTSDFDTTTLGPDSWWVMGDLRANSQDSRFFGAVHTADIEAVWSSTLPAGATGSDLPPLSPDETPSTDSTITPATTTPATTTHRRFDPGIRCVASKAAVATAIEAYYSKEGHYPDHLQQLVAAGFVSDFGGTLDQVADTVTSTGGGDSPGFVLTYFRSDDNNYDLQATTC